jgi:hypothetical protein
MCRREECDGICYTLRFFISETTSLPFPTNSMSGTVIGKALGRLDKGIGIIEMLGNVTLRNSL